MADALLAAVERDVAGTYLMPSFGRYEQAAELVRRIRARHQPRDDVIARLTPRHSRPIAGPSILRAMRRLAILPSVALRTLVVAGSRAPRARRRPGRRSRTRSRARRSTTTAASSAPRPIEQAEQIIDAIEAQTSAEVVVYTQLGRDRSRTDEAEKRRDRAHGPVGRRRAASTTAS